MNKLHFKKIWLGLLCLVALLVTLTACSADTPESTDQTPTEPVISVVDGYLAVNGDKTDYKVSSEAVVSVIDGYVAVNGVKTDYKVSSEAVVSVIDGYVAVNGVKTDYQVKDNNHTFGDWTLYNEDETDCEKKLYYRTCPHCATIEWKEGSYQDHDWNTVTTKPTCQAGGYDTKTCKLCGKTEICNETPVANHEYKAEYDSDSTFHWKSCQHCTSVKDKGEHTLNADGSCSVCAALVGPTEGIAYELSDDGTYALVMAYNGSAKAVKIAEEYNGVPVQVIYNSAFKETAITSVIIPETVTAIGSRAFQSSDIRTITFAGNSQLTTIGNNAFYLCFYLTTINIPASVTTIGDYAFWISGLKSVTFAESSQLTTIGNSAFKGLDSLTTINIPASVTSIGNDAFEGCDQLITENNYFQYVKSGNNPYYLLIGRAYDMSTCEIQEGTRIIANGVFSYSSRLSSIHIPASVTTIGDNAFYDCSNLKTVTFAENSQLTTIGDYAFYSCSSLTSVTIPASVKAIGDCAFRECPSLTSIHFGGTKAQWQDIEKGSSWNYSTGQYTIYCTDGNLSK